MKFLLQKFHFQKNKSIISQCFVSKKTINLDELINNKKESKKLTKKTINLDESINNKMKKFTKKSLSKSSEEEEEIIKSVQDFME